MIYAGPVFAGRSTSIRALSPTPVDVWNYAEELAVPRPSDGSQVRIAFLNLGSLWCPSFLAARESKYPHHRAMIERVLAFLPVLDGIVFVADSQTARHEANLVELEQLLELLRSQGVDPASVPFVFQLNKRELRDIASISQLQAALATPRCAYVESVAVQRLGARRALETVLELADGRTPAPFRYACQETLCARATTRTLALAGPAAIAAIWPKELLATLAVSPGIYVIDTFERTVEFTGPSGTARIAATVGARARRTGARTVQIEVLTRGQHSPNLTLIGTPAAVDAAQQDTLPQRSYLATQEQGVAVAHYRGRSCWQPGITGDLAIFGAAGTPWIGRDGSGDIVEFGAADHQYDDLPARSPGL